MDRRPSDVRVGDVSERSRMPPDRRVPELARDAPDSGGKRDSPERAEGNGLF